MKHSMEMLHGLHYKLQMMGVPLSRPSYIYGGYSQYAMTGIDTQEEVK